MKKSGTLVLLLAIIGFAASVASAADVAGQWRAEFDSPRGVQKYLFTFQTEGEKLTGKAAVEVGERKREAAFTEVKLTGETLSFVENLSIQGNDMRIRYTGKVGADEIAFTREVGDFGSTEFKATRVSAAAVANAPTGVVTNAPRADAPRRRGGFGGPIVLGPDDKPAFAEPPAGINVKRDNIPHGKLEMVEYDSKTVGTTRKMQVYTPPGYTTDKQVSGALSPARHRR